MTSVSRAAELVGKLLEQLADQHGYVAEVVAKDVEAWCRAMLEAHKQ